MLTAGGCLRRSDGLLQRRLQRGRLLRMRRYRLDLGPSFPAAPEPPAQADGLGDVAAIVMDLCGNLGVKAGGTVWT